MKKSNISSVGSIASAIAASLCCIGLDNQHSHEDADNLLVELIRENLPEFAEGLAAYESFDNWYSREVSAASIHAEATL